MSTPSTSLVSVSGGYWTGSSAVLALLAEHEELASYPEEFSLVSYGQLYAEIGRFLAGSDTTIFSLQGSLYRFAQFNKPEFYYPTRQVLRRVFRVAAQRPRWLYAIRADTAKCLGRDYDQKSGQLLALLKHNSGPREHLTQEVDHAIRQLHAAIANAVTLQCAAPRVTGVLLDQFIAPAYAEAALARDPRLRFVFVDRDWRDQYCEIRTILPAMIRVNSTLGVTPAGEDLSEYKLPPLEFFLALRRRMANIRRRHERELAGQIRWVDFEAAVTQTEATAQSLFAFLSLNVDGWKRGSKFTPERSLRNIGKWRHAGISREIERLESDMNGA